MIARRWGLTAPHFPEAARFGSLSVSFQRFSAGAPARPEWLQDADTALQTGPARGPSGHGISGIREPVMFSTGPKARLQTARRSSQIHRVLGAGSAPCPLSPLRGLVAEALFRLYPASRPHGPINRRHGGQERGLPGAAFGRRAVGLFCGVLFHGLDPPRFDSRPAPIGQAPYSS